MPEISIVIPAYNAQKTISRCLDSIFNQTFKDWEIIIVDDASTDNTAKVVEQILAQKPNGPLVLLRNEKNLGAAVSRNRGAKRAKGLFIIFCDADIALEPTLLEKMLFALKNNPNAAYCYSAFKFGFKTFKLWPFDATKLKQMPYIHTTSLIRRELFPGFDESLKRFQDWDLWLTMLKKNHVGYFIPETLFTVKSGGTMSSWLPKIFYRLPWKSAKIKKYQTAKEIIKQKHNL